MKNNSVNDMTVGSPLRAITTFAIPLIMGYILQQMYLIIDAAIVGRWIGVEALAAVGASSSIMFLIMGFCNVQALPFLWLKLLELKIMKRCALMLAIVYVLQQYLQ